MQERYDFPKRRPATRTRRCVLERILSRLGPSFAWFARLAKRQIAEAGLRSKIIWSVRRALWLGSPDRLGRDEQEKQHDPGNTEGKKAGDEQQLEVNNCWPMLAMNKKNSTIQPI